MQTVLLPTVDPVLLQLHHANDVATSEAITFGSAESQHLGCIYYKFWKERLHQYLYKILATSCTG